MKNMLYSLIFILFCSCNNNSVKYEKILQGLEKNYTAYNYFPKEDAMKYWKLNEAEYKRDSLEYDKIVSTFYHSDKDIIRFLMKYQKDNNHYNSWIRKCNPYSSVRGKFDTISNARGALILIDNYLLNKQNNIIMNDYIDKIHFYDIEKIYNNKNELDDIRNEYKKLVSRFR